MVKSPFSYAWPNAC